MNNASLYFPRRDFSGVNDFYSRRRPNPFSSASFLLDQAISGQAPYDVTGVALTDSMRDEISSRLNRYKEGENFYKGDQFVNPFQEGEKKAVFNFCRIVVDKAVDWSVADGWTVTCPEGNEQVAEVLNKIWNHNRRLQLSQKSFQFGAMKGDSYFYVTIRTKDRYGRDVPRNKWTVRIQVLNPSHVHPIWSDSTERVMRACLIQYAIPPSDGEKDAKLFTVYVTPDYFHTWINAEAQPSIPNPIGEVNVVHVPNFELSVSQFGQSDIEPIIPINEEYNIVSNSIRRIIKYHAEPTTVIYGIRASQLEKGANKVWSGLPKPSEAKIENLTLDSDLNANFSYLKSLKTLICEISDTPQIAFDSFESNTRLSGANTSALEILFQPLMEKTKRRQVPYTEAISEVNRLVLLFEEIVLNQDIASLADNIEELYVSSVEYTSPLPRDEATELDLGIKRVSAGVWSQAEFIRRCSGVKNYERLIVELIADKRYALADAYEKQRALLGERPNSLSAFIGSETLSEDVLDLMQQVALLEKTHKALENA